MLSFVYFDSVQCRANGEMVNFSYVKARKGVDGLILEKENDTKSYWKQLDDNPLSLVSCYDPQKQLGATPLPLVVLPRTRLLCWENKLHSANMKALTDSEECMAGRDSMMQQMDELIQASKTSTINYNLDIENIRDQLEYARKDSLYWRKKATQLYNILESRDRSACASPFKSEGTQEDARLLAEIYDQKLQDSEDRHVLELNRMKYDLQADYEFRTEQLMNERFRMSAALQCIKEITGRSKIDETENDSSQCCMNEVEAEQPAVGVPIEESLDIYRSVSTAVFSQDDSPKGLSLPDSHNSVSKVQSPGNEFPSTPESYNFRPGDMDCIPILEEYTSSCIKNCMHNDHALVNLLESSPGISNSVDIQKDGCYHERTSDEHILVNNVSKKKEFCLESNVGYNKKFDCKIVDYNGDHPDVVNEAAISRILDAPLQTQFLYKNPRIQEAIDEINGASFDNDLKIGDSYARTSLAINTESSKISFPESPIEYFVGPSKSRSISSACSPTSPDRSDEWEKQMDSASVENPFGRIFIKKSPSLGEKTENQSNEDPLAMRLSAALNTLDAGSPRDTNLLVQHIADRVAVHASLPSKKHRDRKQKTNLNFENNTYIENLRDRIKSSMPVILDKNTSKKASFLTRRPIEISDLYCS